MGGMLGNNDLDANLEEFGGTLDRFSSDGQVEASRDAPNHREKPCAKTRPFCIEICCRYTLSSRI